MQDEQPTQAQTRVRLSLPPIVQRVVGAILSGWLVAWIAQILACYNALWNYCDFSHALTIAGLVALIVLAPLAATYRERALRRASRGMWARRTGGGYELVATFNKVARLVIVGEEEEPAADLITGTDRFKQLGWWIDLPIDGGTRLWVDRCELWLWLIEVEKLRYRMGPGESVIGERYWEPRIGRPLWMAYIQILEAIGAADCRTGDPRSRRYRGNGDTWGEVEQYEKWRKQKGLSPSRER